MFNTEGFVYFLNGFVIFSHLPQANSSRLKSSRLDSTRHTQTRWKNYFLSPLTWHIFNRCQSKIFFFLKQTWLEWGLQDDFVVVFISIPTKKKKNFLLLMFLLFFPGSTLGEVTSVKIGMYKQNIHSCSLSFCCFYTSSIDELLVLLLKRRNFSHVHASAHVMCHLLSEFLSSEQQ